MAPRAERDQVRQGERLAAVGNRNDVMDLEPISRAASTTTLAVSSSCCRSRLLPADAASDLPLTSSA
jgi:hypothetical protein